MKGAEKVEVGVVVLAAKKENAPATEQLTEKVAIPIADVVSARVAIAQLGPVEVRSICMPARADPSSAYTENT